MMETRGRMVLRTRSQHVTITTSNELFFTTTLIGLHSLLDLRYKYRNINKINIKL